MCFVQVGAMKTKTKLENLRLVEEKKESKKQPTPSKVGKKLVSNFSRKSGMELDIRGMLGDDGVMEVDRFIDSCLLSGISVITIIHGREQVRSARQYSSTCVRIPTSNRSVTVHTERAKPELR